VATKVKTAVIYARISQDRDDTQAGVKRQLADCRKLAKDMGLQVVGEFIDNDVSAMSKKRRPEYEAMLELVKAGTASAIVCWATDRLYRKTRDLEALIDDIGLAAVFTCKSGEVDLSTSDGRMFARMMGAVAQGASEKAGERIARARQQAAAEGRFQGGTRRFGFEKDGVTIRKDEAKALARAFDLLLGGRSVGWVARDLQRQGFKGSMGRPMDGTTIKRMMLSPRYVGLCSYKGKVTGPAVWPAIVSEDVFNQAKAILLIHRPKFAPARGSAPVSLLGGILFCPRCEKPMYATTAQRKNHKHPVYQCKIGCSSRGREYVDEFIEQVIITRLATASAKGKLVRTPKKVKVSTDYARAEELRRNLETMHTLATTMDPMDYHKAVTQYRSELDLIESRLVVTENRAASAALGLDVAKTWAALDLDGKRTVIKEQVAKVVALPGAPRVKDRERVPEFLDIVWIA
jgi:DNA invertase Pin-like site-specific DNA recombinase